MSCSFNLWLFKEKRKGGGGRRKEEKNKKENKETKKPTFALHRARRGGRAVMVTRPDCSAVCAHKVARPGRLKPAMIRRESPRLLWCSPGCWRCLFYKLVALLNHGFSCVPKAERSAPQYCPSSLPLAACGWVSLCNHVSVSFLFSCHSLCPLLFRSCSLGP